MRKLLARLLGPVSGSAGDALRLHASRTCTECGTKLAALDSAHPRDEDAAWHCPNQDCPTRIRERIAHWCSPEAMDIPGVDAALVRTLVGKGLAFDVGEIYRLKLKEIAALEGMNPEAAQRFFDAITASMKRDAVRLLFGLAIPTVGLAEAAALGQGFPSVDAVFAAGATRLMREAGVSEAVAQNLTGWYADATHRRLVRRLEKAGLNFKSESYRPVR